MLLLAALCLAAAFAPVHPSLLSPTNESVTQTTSEQICPDSPKDLEWLGDFQLPEYVRQPRKQLRLSLQHGSVADRSSVHIQGTAGKLQDIYAAHTVLPSLALQKGISNLGDTRRLERTLFKLLSGQAVTIVALGGSITAGVGPENQQLTWVSRTFAWINATFPHPGHRLLNHAIPAVASIFVAPCLEALVPADTDLVLLEFTFNDITVGGSDDIDRMRRGMEKLLRKLMHLNRGTAVINLHFHPFKDESYSHWQRPQDRIETLFEYYAVSSLSMRSGLHTMIDEQPWLLTKLWPATDGLHPSCVGCRFMSDLVVGFLQDVAAHVATAGHHHLPHAEVLTEALPPPILMDAGADDKPEACITDESFASLAGVNQGWSWVDEARRPGQRKLGYVSHLPGDVITLKVPLDDFRPVLGDDRRLVVALGMLMSYEHMGTARVTCLGGGCSCEAKDFNCLFPWDHRFSMTNWKGLVVTVGSDSSQECEMHIENANRTNSGEHKVKLTSMLLSLDIESYGGGFVYENRFD